MCAMHKQPQASPKKSLMSYSHPLCLSILLLHVCIYIDVCVHVHVYACVCMSMCVCVWVEVCHTVTHCVHGCCVCVCVLTCACTYMYMCVCMSMCMCVWGLKFRLTVVSKQNRCGYISTQIVADTALSYCTQS